MAPSRVEVSQTPNIEGMMVPMGGMEGMDHNFTEMLQDMLPKRKKRRTVSVAEARRILMQEELDRLVDMDEVVNEALDRAEETGIIFLDEIDKISGDRGGVGPDVSREGVQRDLLPIVEGSNVGTKYGLVRTDHILFIAAGAFHVSKPSDLIPELQGRFPIRVELHSLGEEDFVRIRRSPRTHSCINTGPSSRRKEPASSSRKRGSGRSPASRPSSTNGWRTSGRGVSRLSSPPCWRSSSSSSRRRGAKRSWWISPSFRIG